MEIVYVIIGCIILFLFFYIKEIIWDKPRNEIQRLNRQLHIIEDQHQEELITVKEELNSTHSDELQQLIRQLHISEYQHREELITVKKELNSTRKDLNDSNEKMKVFESNLTAIPYMAGMISDIETYGLEELALGLSWGHSQKRLDKVKSIREIRRDARAMVEKNKEAQYQLAYLLELFPNLSDVIECEFKQLPIIEVNALSDYDATRDYLSKEEYDSLTVIERNQLALDRYNNSHNKSKWQIGRDYEEYVGYKYRKKGYQVDQFGAYMGMEDLGRDIIAKKDGKTLIIQCKYWSTVKEIHEKHITQLYGTLISYCIENNVEQSKVEGVLITNIRLSEMAKKMANYLDIKFVENYKLGEYPCIKCNIGHDEFGKTKIYHLPFDQQYDSTKIKDKGEFYAMTVAEAEDAGFRRAFKWFGNS